MIVPRSSLLFWFALVVVPLCVVIAIEPALLLPALGGAAAFAAIAIVDAWRAGPLLREISVEAPPVSRLSKDRPGKLELSLRNPSQRRRSLRVALALPREIKTDKDDVLVELPAGAEWSRVRWDCEPTRRGNFPLNAAFIEGASPLGLWAARRRAPLNSELRVYPNLMTERKNLAALFLNRGGYGLHAQRQVGKGRDFEKLRDYIPGDSFDEIHWKATARRGKPVTKVFQIERTQEIYVVVDASRLSGRRPAAGAAQAPDRAGEATDTAGSDSILERFVTAALVLGLAAEQQGDLFGLMTFSDTVHRFVRAKNGKAHYSVCRDSLYTLQPRSVTPDFDELCTFIRLRLRRRALIVVLTSLDDPALAESFVRNIELVRRQHLVLVGMIQPPGTRPFFSRGSVETVDDLYGELGGHLQWARLQEVGKTLQRRGVRFSMLQKERLSAEVVSEYLNIKRRQLL